MEIITNAEKNQKTLYHKTAYTFQSLKEILEKMDLKILKNINGRRQFIKTMTIIHKPIFLTWIRKMEH